MLCATADPSAVSSVFSSRFWPDLSILESALLAKTTSSGTQNPNARLFLSPAEWGEGVAIDI